MALTLLFINKIFLSLIITLGGGLGFWVYFSDPKRASNKMFSLVSFLSVSWGLLCFLANTAPNISVGLFWTRLAEVVVMLALLSLYFFSIYFPQKSKGKKLTNIILVCLALVIIVLVIFTDLITLRMLHTEQWGLSPVPGRLWLFFNFVSSLILVLTLYKLASKYPKLSKREKLKSQYSLLGLFLFVIFNVVFNIILPLYNKDYRFVLVGTNAFLFFLGFTAYAIVKKELFGIKVVLTQMLVGVMAILLFVNFIGSKSVFEYAWKGALFGMFLFFGYLLIRSVVKEIERSAELEKAYKKLKKVDKAKSEFIAMASHQLRTPLTIVKGLSSMLLENIYGEIDKKKKEPLEDIFRSNERLINLVNDLLNISRVDLGKMELTIEKIDIAEMITDITRTLRPRAEAKGLKLEWEAPAEPILAEADSIKIRQIILNIIDNAVKYTVKGKIEVIVKDLGAKVRIIVKDTGEGLTKEEKEEIFESFTRGAAGLRFSIQGTGLGLYLAKKYIELHGGKIWAESEGEAKGSSFYVELSKKKNAVLMGHMNNNNNG